MTIRVETRVVAARCRHFLAAHGGGSRRLGGYRFPVRGDDPARASPSPSVLAANGGGALARGSYRFPSRSGTSTHGKKSSPSPWNPASSLEGSPSPEGRSERGSAASSSRVDENAARNLASSPLCFSRSASRCAYSISNRHAFSAAFSAASSSNAIAAASLAAATSASRSLRRRSRFAANSASSSALDNGGGGAAGRGGGFGGWESIREEDAFVSGPPRG